MKKRILFVDDEPRILDGLRHRLRRLRKKWEMSFVESGQEALEVLGGEPIDVIVSDMRMPGMDGAALLTRVQKEYPDLVRIVLSGHSELEASLRAVRVAHQFLNKPCEAGVLENVIERACDLQALIGDSVVRKAVGQIECLPALPRVYAQLQVALSDENVSVDPVARILKQDLSMCAKLLQIANSAFFRLSRTISRVEDAVTYLGFDTIKHLTLTIEVFGRHSPGTRLAGLSPELLQKHSLLTATIASGFFDERDKKEDAFSAGLLHDVGKLLLAMELPRHIEEVLAGMRERGGPMHVAEERQWGVTHAEVGAYLLGLWGLPYPLVEAVANHHAPGRVQQQEFDILAAVHVADSLANEHGSPVISGLGSVAVDMDQAYLDELGVGTELDKWRQRARELTDAVSSGSSAAAGSRS